MNFKDKFLRIWKKAPILFIIIVGLWIVFGFSELFSLIWFIDVAFLLICLIIFKNKLKTKDL